MEPNTEKKSFKVLLVDDDEFIRLFLRDTLYVHGKETGVEVSLAGTLEEADHELVSNPPDLVFLDLGLPLKEGETPNPSAGFEFLQHIRANQKYKNIQVLIFSGYGDKQLKERAMELGAADYLVKGEFMPQDIVRIVEKIRTAKAS
jgi:CheY-like chemotaxis protein